MFQLTTMRMFAGRASRFRSGAVPAACALLVGLLITCIAASFVRDWEVRERRARLQEMSAGYVAALQGHIIRSLEALYAIDALFHARQDVSRAEFRDFVSGTLARRPEIQGLAWDPRVPGAARDRWEARAHEDGVRGFQFVEQERDGGLTRAGDRAEYFPVYFMENVSGNEPALGFDLLSEERRRAALERARDTALPVATAPLRLIQEQGSQLGFLVLLPVYQGLPASVRERRLALRGFAVAVFRIGDLVDAALQPVVRHGIGVRVVDVDSGDVVFEQGGAGAGGEPTWAARADVAGRFWALSFESPPASALSLWPVWTSLLAGSAVTFVLASYLWSHGRRLKATERRVLEATADLSAEVEERRGIERQLRAARDDLEDRVRRRTVELASSNEALQAEVAIRQRAEALAETASRARSTFLANMSHEIRTPLNAILGYAQILLRGERLDAFEREAMDTIASSSNHLLRLINEILDLAKIDAGRMEVIDEEFDLEALVREIAVMFGPLCDTKRLTLRIAGPESRTVHGLIGDAGKLRQVLINLLGNAVKFTDHGVVTLRVVAEPDSRWRFEVEDTGPGIPAALADLVFDPFQQVQRGGQGGTGLGLSIAYRHVELMGGRLSLQNAGGRGCLFSFTVDLPHGATPPSRMSQVGARWRLAPGTQVRALVVDDVPENRAVLSTMLQLAGCDTLLAGDGERAVQLARQARPDIVFMDLRLPGSDGIDAARRIVASTDPRRVRIVATSASVLDGERERCLAGGCDEFLPKPFRVEEIHACLRRLPGVELVAESGSVELPAEAEDSPSPLMVSTALASRMRQAAGEHNSTALRSCLADLERSGTPGRGIADRLGALLARYDMDAIQRIVEGLAESAAAPADGGVAIAPIPRSEPHSGPSPAVVQHT